MHTAILQEVGDQIDEYIERHRFDLAYSLLELIENSTTRQQYFRKIHDAESAWIPTEALLHGNEAVRERYFELVLTSD